MVYALYKQVLGQVRCLRGLSWLITNTIFVKQECPHSPPFVNSTSMRYHIWRWQDNQILGTLCHVFLYVDDIILVCESPTSIQHHLNVLYGIFHGKRAHDKPRETRRPWSSTHPWLLVSKLSSPRSRGQVEVIDSYVYLGITFTSTMVASVWANPLKINTLEDMHSRHVTKHTSKSPIPKNNYPTLW